MPATQIIFGVGLVALMLGVAGFQLWRQLTQFRALRDGEILDDDERHYLRRRVWRRLGANVLLAVLAVLLAGALLFLEVPAQRLADERPADPPTPDQRGFLRLYGYFWIVFLLVLLTLLVLAALDFWATRRHGAEQFRRLQADRRTMIESQMERLREDRWSQD